MKRLWLLFPLLLSGCTAVKHTFTPVSDSKLACDWYQMCGPNVGMQRTGSTVCYIDDITLPKEKQRIACW
jgi:hypothetical protein